MNIKRRKSIPVKIGNVTVGGDNPIIVQSMTKTDTHNVTATLKQIKELTKAGCELVRIAIPDMEAVEALKTIKRKSPIPIIADIHFDYRLALAAIEANADAIRLNPGNIKDKTRISTIVKAARDHGIPIRIGINAGSLQIKKNNNTTKAKQMVDAACEQIELMEKLNFKLIKVSLKASDILTTIEAYREIAKIIPYPLHIGITEAGPPRTGLIRSAIGIGLLLAEGIGDTIRVSLTADPILEIDAAYEILNSLNLRRRGINLISCPTCGRCQTDLLKIVNIVDKKTRHLTKNITIAVMGCAVNGPGEAREADIGIACGKGKGLLFKKGKIIRTVPENNLVEELFEEIKKY